MAVSVFSLYPFSFTNASTRTATFVLFKILSQSLSLSHPLLGLSSAQNVQARKKRKSKFLVVVKSTHSNAKVLKSNRRSRYGQALNPYYDSHEEEEEEEEDEDRDDDDVADYDWLLDDEFAEPAEFEVDGKRFKSQRRSNARQGGQKQSEVRIGKNSPKRSNSGEFSYGKYRSLNANADDREIKGKESGDHRYQKLSEIDLDKKWLPLLDYLSTFGLQESHFIQMYERQMPSVQINACNAQERLDYLFSVGVKHRDIKRILLRQPQILEYTVEKNLKLHVGFLRSLGIPSSKIGQIIAVAPSLFSYSVENSLKPTVRYLVEEVGINEKNICKVVQLSPRILVQRIDISWNTRYIFLSKELGASRDSVVKMVTKHPQLLHYGIDDGLLPRINFLRSIGMRNSEILKVLTSLTQVLSLSLEDNLRPKYMYLINELRNEVQSLTKYPMYLRLSLDQRIRPRHGFLVALKKAPKGPFPLSSLVPTDECFCQQWAGTSVDKYLAFRQQLLLKDFSKGITLCYMVCLCY